MAGGACCPGLALFVPPPPVVAEPRPAGRPRPGPRTPGRACPARSQFRRPQRPIQTRCRGGRPGPGWPDPTLGRPHVPEGLPEPLRAAKASAPSSSRVPASAHQARFLRPTPLVLGEKRELFPPGFLLSLLLSETARWKTARGCFQTAQQTSTQRELFLGETLRLGTTCPISPSRPGADTAVPKERQDLVPEDTGFPGVFPDLSKKSCSPDRDPQNCSESPDLGPALGDFKGHYLTRHLVTEAMPTTQIHRVLKMVIWSKM